MKKILCGFLALTIGTMFCAGCNSKEESSRSRENIFGLDKTKEVTLTIVGGLENFEGLEAVISKFEDDFPNCSINYEMMDAYGENISTRLKNESGSTSMFLSSRSDFIGEEKLKGSAYDLRSSDSLINLSAVNQDITKSQEMEGKLYTLPVAMAPRGLVVNKTLLAEHKVKIPTKFEEFMSACETFKQANITPIHAEINTMGLCLVYSYFANSIVHDENYKTIFEEMNSFTEGSGKYIEDICQRLDKIASEGYIEYERTKEFPDNYDKAIMNFFEGDVPFFPCSAETVSGMKKREEKSEAFSKKPFEYEFICTPIADDGAYCYWQVWHGISINKDSDNIEWSRAFMDFLAQEDNLNLLAQTKGMPPNTENKPKDERYASLYSMDAEHTAQAAEFQISFYSQLNKTVQTIVKPSDDDAHLDAAAAVKYFEELIAEKRNKK